MVFCLSYATVRSALARANEAMKLPDDLHFTTHSFRHGGASYLYIKGAPINDIVERGRWSSVKTARRYIQAGVALIFGTALPQAIQQRAAELETNPNLLLDLIARH